MIKSVTPISPVQFPNTLLQKKEPYGSRTKNGKKKKSKDERKADFMTLQSTKGRGGGSLQKRSTK